MCRTHGSRAYFNSIITLGRIVNRASHCTSNATMYMPPFEDLSVWNPFSHIDSNRHSGKGNSDNSFLKSDSDIPHKNKKKLRIILLLPSVSREKQVHCMVIHFLWTGKIIIYHLPNLCSSVWNKKVYHCNL